MVVPCPAGDCPNPGELMKPPPPWAENCPSPPLLLEFPGSKIQKHYTIQVMNWYDCHWLTRWWSGISGWWVDDLVARLSPITWWSGCKSVWSGDDLVARSRLSPISDDLVARSRLSPIRRWSGCKIRFSLIRWWTGCKTVLVTGWMSVRTSRSRGWPTVIVTLSDQVKIRLWDYRLLWQLLLGHLKKIVGDRPRPPHEKGPAHKFFYFILKKKKKNLY
jgi:hypothetical protein